MQSWQVKKGGFFLNWSQACLSTEGFSGNRHQGCTSIEEAEALLIQDGEVSVEELKVYLSYDGALM